MAAIRPPLTGAGPTLRGSWPPNPGLLCAPAGPATRRSGPGESLVPPAVRHISARPIVTMEPCCASFSPKTSPCCGMD
jgi:hypothetical protein